MNAYQIPSVAEAINTFESRPFEGGTREYHKARAKVVAGVHKARKLAERAMLQRRWMRKAGTRLTAKDAAKLAELQQDVAYRFGFWGPDWVAERTPGGSLRASLTRTTRIPTTPSASRATSATSATGCATRSAGTDRRAAPASGLAIAWSSTPRPTSAASAASVAAAGSSSAATGELGHRWHEHR